MSTPQKSLIRLSVFIILLILLIFNLGSSPFESNLHMMTYIESPLSMPPPPGWYAFPNNGMDDGVFALEYSADDLYAGGSFKASGDGSLAEMGGIARFNIPSLTWHTFSNQGLDDGVDALAYHRGNLYAGGHFSKSGDETQSLPNIARYDVSTNTWHTLPNKSLDNHVTSFAVMGEHLYVGGWFEGTIDGAFRDLGHIVRYNTAIKSWEALSNQGLDSAVFALVSKGRDLYAAGRFKTAGI